MAKSANDYLGMPETKLKQVLQAEVGVAISPRGKEGQEMHFAALYKAICAQDVEGVKKAFAAGASANVSVICGGGSRTLLDFATKALSIEGEFAKGQENIDKSERQADWERDLHGKARAELFGVGRATAHYKDELEAERASFPFKLPVDIAAAGQIIGLIKEHGGLTHRELKARRIALDAIETQGDPLQWNRANDPRSNSMFWSTSPEVFYVGISESRTIYTKVFTIRKGKDGSMEADTERNPAEALKLFRQSTSRPLERYTADSPTARLVAAVKANDLMGAADIFVHHGPLNYGGEGETVNANLCRYVRQEQDAYVPGKSSVVRKSLIEGAFGEVSPAMRALLFRNGGGLTSSQMTKFEGQLAAQVPIPEIKPPTRPADEHPGLLDRIFGYGLGIRA